MKKKLIYFLLLFISLFLLLEIFYKSNICYNKNPSDSKKHNLLLKSYQLYKSEFFEKNKYITITKEPFLEKCCVNKGFFFSRKRKVQNNNVQLNLFYDSIREDFNISWSILLNDSIPLFHFNNYNRLFIIDDLNNFPDSLSFTIYKYLSNNSDLKVKVGNLVYYSSSKESPTQRSLSE